MKKWTIATFVVLLIAAVGLSACQPVMPVSVGRTTRDSVGKVLQIHFQYDITADEYRAAVTSLAGDIGPV